MGLKIFLGNYFMLKIKLYLLRIVHEVLKGHRGVRVCNNCLTLQPQGDNVFRLLDTPQLFGLKTLSRQLSRVPSSAIYKVQYFNVQ